MRTGCKAIADPNTLRPEVREALKSTELTVEMFDTLVTMDRADYDTIRAELLRLAEAEKERGELLRLLAEEIVEARETSKLLNRRAQVAEAELAALKARIEAAEVFTCYAAIISGRDYDYISAILRHDDPAYQYPDLDGKRVQLLVEGWRETYSAVGFVPVAGVWTCVRHIALPDVRSWQHGQGLEHRLYDRPDMQRRGQRTCGRNHQRPRCQSRRASRNLGMPAVLVVGQDTTATL
jgi:hypothetical protein